LGEAIEALEAKSPAAGGWISEGKATMPPEAKGSGNEAPSAGRFLQFFSKNYAF